jgi:hypothetical protein
MVCWLAWAGSLTAQVTVEVLLDQEQFLRDESLPVKVRVVNRSGQTLRLGQDNEWLDFVVQDTQGHILGKLSDVPVKGEFTLESAEMATRLVDLMPHFEFDQPGRYQVTATVRIAAWNAETTSKAKNFEIVRGTKLWEQEFGVPTDSGAPEVRKYALQQANYRKQLKLYVRLTDADENRAFGVWPLGLLVSFSRPEAQIDKSSHLHVLFQTGARSFAYAMLDPHGTMLLRQTHDYAETRPSLRTDEAGKIYVVGGQRRFASNDLPPSLLTNLTSLLESSNSPPGTTNPAAPANQKAKGRKK